MGVVQPPKDDDGCCYHQDGAQYTDLPRESLTVSLIGIVLTKVVTVVTFDGTDVT